ncbi:hypothetical protein MUBE_10910 [Mycobacterium uberis]|uniref:Uncharacterized protein n=1 Tax=Mycobacterium uberis TaxID=2162698 RepID=A0A3E1HFY9_9MYCO|nr:hypothetical protein [Mycobacterium uberis]RFD25174.1 hypothetical protein MUBE_10910 [Mycobacterium uberis]
MGIFIHTGITTGCLDSADKKPVTVGTFIKPRNLSSVMVTGPLLLVATAILALACVIPAVPLEFVS